jgi:hypothetical protein
LFDAKVIPFPSPHREEEPPATPGLPPPAPPVPPAEAAQKAGPPTQQAPSVLEPTVREPIVERRLSAESAPDAAPAADPVSAHPVVPVAPAAVLPVAAGPGGTIRTAVPGALVRSDEELPVAGSNMSSSTIEDSPPSSRGSRADGSARHSEEQFFQAGEEGTYEGGHASIRPLTPHDEHEVAHHRPLRTPEQEERRARFIRWVVLAMGFGIAMSVMGVVLQRVAPPPVAPVVTDEPAVPVAEPPPVATAVQPEPQPEPAPPPPAAAEVPPVTAPEPSAAPPPAEPPKPEPVAAKPEAPPAPPAPTAKPASAPSPAAAKPAPPPRSVAAAPAAKPKLPAATAVPAPPAPAPPSNTGTASFPVD